MKKMMKKKKIILPILVVVLAGAGFKFMAPSKAEPKLKVHGEVYVLPKEFVINLADGRFAKLGVGLVLPPEALAAAAGHGGGTAPPEGYGPLPQEALVRDLVTDTLTDGSADELVGKEGRERLKEKILKQIKKHSDVKPEEVLFTDVAVQ